MSHLKERTEKNCLNCNAHVYGKFCHICGQENLEPAESAWHLITHFFNDITHFDGKFFSTLRLLIFKPGFLSTEYKMGRRNSYLNPVRMYVFTSFLFFLVFFSLYHVDEKMFGETQNITGQKVNSPELNQVKAGQLKANKDSIKAATNSTKKMGITFNEEFASRGAYDSALKTTHKKDNWLKRTLMYKQFDIKEKYGDDQGKLLGNLLNILMHNFPQILFLSLPLIALFLKLLFIRRKEFYFVSHGIFTIHLYIFYFIGLLLIIFVSKIGGMLHWTWLVSIAKLLALIFLIYEYKAMHNFYGQRRGKTILKFLLLGLWRFIIVLILFVLFLFFSFLKV